MAVDPRSSRRRPGQTPREFSVATGESREPLRGEDLSSTTKKVINANLHERGSTQVASMENRLEGLRGRAEANPTPKNVHDVKGVENVLGSGAIKDAPITPGSATRARKRLFQDAESHMPAPEADRNGQPKAQYPDAYGWYFEHRRDLNEVAGDLEHGKSDPVIGQTRPPASRATQESVVNASAVMAAANSPDNEKAAVAAFGGLLRDDPTLEMSSDVEQNLGARSGTPVSQLSSRQVAEATMTKNAPGITPELPKDTRRGSVSSRNADAVGFLRGELGDADIPEKFPAQTQAKLGSYRQNIIDAEPNSGVEDEYMARYQDTQRPDQGRLDLFGLQQSKEGILGTRSVEDTWMNAISSGQQLETVPGTKTSPAKNVSSDSQTYAVTKKAEIDGETVSDTAPKVGGAAMLHAWNNARTTGAAESLSKGSPTTLPSTAVQEVSWTEARRQAGKDAAFSAGQRGVGAGVAAVEDAGVAQGSMDPRTGSFAEGVRPKSAAARDMLGYGAGVSRPKAEPITMHDNRRKPEPKQLERNWSEDF